MGGIVRGNVEEGDAGAHHHKFGQIFLHLIADRGSVAAVRSSQKLRGFFGPLPGGINMLISTWLPHNDH